MSLSIDERFDILESATRRLTYENRSLMVQTGEMRKQIFVQMFTLEAQNEELRLLHEMLRRLIG